jgi:hypothetical protein
MCINKWNAVLSRAILHENRVTGEMSLLEVNSIYSMHGHVFGVLDFHLSMLYTLKLLLFSCLWYVVRDVSCRTAKVVDKMLKMMRV